MFAKYSLFVFPALCAGVSAETFVAPPTPPPTLEAAPQPRSAAADSPFSTAAAAQFSIGNPSDQAQLYLELINRARVNPNAEAQRLASSTDPAIVSPVTQFGVDLSEMIRQFSLLTPAAPLSFEARLIEAARGHNQYQFDTASQTHVGANGIDLGDRLEAVSYPFLNAGENVYSYAKDVGMGHAGFEIDWGNGPFGMQTPAGHRLSIHNPQFTEVGIHVILGTKTINGQTVGPMLVTQDFGRPQNVRPYVTGVAYYDINGNNFYDLGEGMGGVTVTVDGASAFAVTTASGGFSIPVATSGSYTVRFNAPNMGEVARNVQVSGGSNVKADLTRNYAPPAIKGPASPFVGAANLYTFTSVEGATDYNARVRTLAVQPLEGAEGSVDHLQFTTTGTYPTISTTVRASGTKSFHLAHPGARAESMQFSGEFYVRAGARLDFKSRLGIATAVQSAHVQVSTDGGVKWTSLYSQAGVNVGGGADTSEKTFIQRSASLANYAGKVIKARFLYDIQSGQYFGQSGDGFGWYVDDISFVNASKANTVMSVATGGAGTFQFTPPSAGSYLIDAQPVNLARALPASASLEVSAQAGTPSTLVFTRGLVVARGTVTLQFDRTGSASSFVLQSAANPAATQWTTETSATFSAPTDSRYSVSVPANGAARFYRLRTN